MSDYVIPEDCWPEILKRLPAKSLGQFRCVCRGWDALICSSSFIARHLDFSKAKPRVFINDVHQIPSEEKSCAIFDSESSAATFIPHILPTDPFYYRIAGSAKGILCCLHVRDGHDYSLRLEEIRCEIILWNPVINKYIKLPDKAHTRFGSNWDLDSIAIGVKPSEEDDLRVLAFRSHESAEIYSVGQGAWRPIQANFPSSNISHYSESKSYADGAAHWVATDNADSCMLIQFGFEEEEFSCITLPDVLAYSHPLNLRVVVYCGRLALFQQNRGHSSWKIWTRSGAEDSWSVMVCVHPLEEYVFIHGITHDAQILMEGYNSKNGRDDLVLYNLTSASFREVDVLQAGPDGLIVCPFVESLFFMDGEGGALSLPRGCLVCDGFGVVN